MGTFIVDIGKLAPEVAQSKAQQKADAKGGMKTPIAHGRLGVGASSVASVDDFALEDFSPRLDLSDQGNEMLLNDFTDVQAAKSHAPVKPDPAPILTNPGSLNRGKTILPPTERSGDVAAPLAVDLNGGAMDWVLAARSYQEADNMGIIPDSPPGKTISMRM